MEVAKKNINGVLILDKPVGMSSNAVLQKVKRLFNARKAGHTGSLDPLASGVLPICFGEATKLSQFLLNADKHYQVQAQLGVKTNTADAEGEVVSTRPVGNLNNAQLEKILDHFRGDIEQIPPMYSAIKHQGQPLYKLARKGIEVERKKRQVTIHDLQLLDYQDALLTLRVHSSKGTYIRTLIDDVGELLGCGAHVVSLRRLTAGSFHDHQAVSYSELTELAEKSIGHLQGKLLPLESMLNDLMSLQLDSVTSHYISRGQAVRIADAPDSGFVALRAWDHRFICIAEVGDDGKSMPKRLLWLFAK